MLYFKALGAIFLLASAGLAGLWARRFFCLRYKQALGFLTLLQHTRRQIDCFSLPIKQILASCDRELLCDLGARGEVSDFAELIKGDLYLEEQICELLQRFCAELGKGYREDQLRACDYYIDALSPYCNQLREDLVRCEKIAVFLPIAIAAIALLLLL